MSVAARRFQRTNHTPVSRQALFSLWPNDPAPSVASENDTSSIELGVRFQSGIDATVTAVRFYKGASNTGTHTGSLWTNTGTLLGTVTFTNETASGWQTAYFSTPIAISANTLYVVSYHAPNGYYSGNSEYFTSNGVTSGVLTAPSNTVASNGVYVYASSTTFPTDQYQATNYWVDVIVAGPNDTVAPTAPTNLTATVTGMSVQLSWTASTDAVGVATYRVYRDGVHVATTATTSYQDQGVQASTSYTYAVRAVDYSGNVSQPSSDYALVTGSDIAPTASFEVTAVGVTAYTTAANSTDTDGTITAFVWNWGDGASSNAKNDSHTYASDGTYTITLTVTDNGGATNSLQKQVTVSAASFTANVIASPHTGGYPDETNTGVPAGTTLTAYSGSYYIQTDNTVIDGMDINGIVVIQANNVTIRNTRITTNDFYPIRRDTGTGLLVEDSEIIGTSTDVTCGIGFDNYTARRVNVHGTVDGFKTQNNVVLEDCYVHDLTVGNGTHNDGAQSTGGNNVTIKHCTFKLGGADVNACLQIGNEDGGNSNWLVQNCLIDGGGFTINSSSDPTINSNMRFTGNRFTRNYTYGIGGVGGATWITNYYDNDGTAASPSW